AVPYRKAVHQAGGRWIEDFPTVNRPAQHIRRNLGVGENGAEISRLECVNRGSVAKTREHTRSKLQPIEIREKEELVLAVDDLRNNDRSTRRKPERVIALFAWVVGKESPRVESIVREVFVQASMQIIRS